MNNIIPKPLKAKKADKEVCFSTNTVLCGEFLETVKLFEHLIPKAAEACNNKLTFVKNGDIDAEGYTIGYDCCDIIISASDSKGALNGFMTLVQMSAGKEKFEAYEIEDKPKFKWRGFMLDCSRHFSTMERIKKTLDYMAMLKYSVFHWHLCDDQGWRIEIKKYPVLCEHGSIRKGTSDDPAQIRDTELQYTPGEYGRGLYYTQDDAREIVAYAAARGITVIPEIDVPGHATAIVSCMPELSCTGEPVDVDPRFGILEVSLCPSKQKVYDVLFDIFDELCEIFPAPYFHIGGDEVVPKMWDNCPECQALIKKHNLKDHVGLHRYFNNFLVAHLRKRGKRTIGWNEMLCPELDKTAIGQFWTFENGLPEALDWVNNQNGEVIITSGMYLYADYPYSRLPLSATYNFNADYLGIEKMENVLGYEFPLWTEYVRSDEKFALQVYPRMLAVAESGWTEPLLKNYENFEYRMENMREYFESIGFTLPPRRTYCGYTFDGAEDMTFFERKTGAFWHHWYGNVDYELNGMK